MSRVVKLKKGLSIELEGSAEKILFKAPLSESYAIKPTDFKGLIPKLLVKVGDKVKAGSPLFIDKYKPDVIFVSPVSGVVESINRGDKRKLLEVVIDPDAEQEAETYDTNISTREEIIELLLKAGLWPYIKQRPYGIIADPAQKPKAIFISGFDSSPLPLDVNFMLSNDTEFFQKGIDILDKLTDKIYLGLDSTDTGSNLNKKIKGVEINLFSGKHPVGNVGVQIHHISPIAKGEIVWTITPQDLVIIGKFFETGVYNAEKIIALAGSEVIKPQYYRVISGFNIKSLSVNINKGTDNDIRYISGNVLTGESIGADGHLGFFHHEVTVIPEGNKYEFLGWAQPRLNKLSISKSYFSWLQPSKKYNLDTNLNGGPRAFVQTDVYDKVLPMDIYSVYLLKAILAEDIDKMEQLGIYEVIEEDLALCEFVCPSKNNIQEILGDGIKLMIEEMS